MQVPVYSLTGEVVDHIEISDHVFAVPFNEGVVHQAMVRQQANARQGTASTKTRSEVAGTSAKMFRQKGTGSARAGSRRSPLRRGGGIAFGPHPRDYSQAMPKKMRQLALRCTLSAKAADKELMVLEELKLDEPKTKQMVQILTALGIDSSALVVTPEPEENLIKSARNLKGIKTTPANLLNVLDILSCKLILITVNAVRRVEELWGERLSKEVKHASL
ncbi:MAG TPA: 50S ribosomal protein L4 [Dehalococcoidales bacterium]|nr:50S ribosomal protein L4 [Dehalococcoidales bacterium]